MASTTSATGAAATKKRKLTAAEKEAERAEKKRKQEAAAEEKAQKQAEKQRAAQEKEAEKARKQRERDEAKAAKEAEKAKVEAERNAKKREKEEKEKAAQKNNQKQRSLMDGFVVKKSTEDETKPAKPEKIYYDTKFQPFFVHPTVTVAPAPFAMDDETKTIKSKILDEYIRGERGDFEPKPFDPQKTFDFAFPIRRGRVQPSVQNIMSHVHENDGEIRLGLSSPMPQADTEKATVDAQKKLNGITMKYLRFWEDVRPAYCGTITNHVTTKKLYKLSRQPAGRIMPLAYDYESEAEWEEDDGEDVDGPEDDEDPDEDEEMDDFVDDSEAAPTTIARPGFLADCEPKSTGICFEDRKRVGPSTTPYKYRLEFLLDTLEHHSYIDPFSGEYWASAPKKAANSNSENSNSTAPLPAGSRTVSGESAGLSTKDVKDAKDLVPDQVMPAFKQALLSKELKVFSKAVVVEMLAHKFDSVTKAQVKATVDTIAHRVTVPGEKKSIKHWALLPAFAS
ncbi:chromatin assembly factor 1 subunit A-domain-containing protein [Xylariomycetidae sp. FL0641]|nr:chromatin assembly factor 1 subunit A-domain-containing protein [Xylariomycetidae sp. FL0641]